MSTHGATTRSVAERVRADSGGTRARAAKTPEQAHAEKVAKAEDAVRQAQAEMDRIQAKNGRQNEGGRITFGTFEETARASRQLAAAQTRLATLRSQNPNETPQQRAAAKKSAAYESKIAKLEQQLAATRAAYEQHKAATGTGQQGQQAGQQAANANAKANAPARATSGGTRTSGKEKAAYAHVQAVWRPAGNRFVGIDPYANPDPFQLRALYGDGQFRTALNNRSVSSLRNTAADLGIRKPGSTRDAVVKAIMDYVQRDSIERTRERYQHARDVLADDSSHGTFNHRPLHELYDLNP